MRVRTVPGTVRTSVAGGAVDGFTEQVGVAVVAGVLLDHVDQHPAQVETHRGHRSRTPVVEIESGDDHIGRSDLATPGRHVRIDGRRIDIVEVAIRVDLSLVVDRSGDVVTETAT